MWTEITVMNKALRYRIVGKVGGVKLWQIWQISFCFTKVLPSKILHKPKFVK